MEMNSFTHHFVIDGLVEGDMTVVFNDGRPYQVVINPRLVHPRDNQPSLETELLLQMVANAEAGGISVLLKNGVPIKEIKKIHGKPKGSNFTDIGAYIVSWLDEHCS